MLLSSSEPFYAGTPPASVDVDPRHPYDQDAPKLDHVEYTDEGYPVPIQVADTFVVFTPAGAAEKRVTLWADKTIGITGQGTTRKYWDERVAKDMECGEELDLYTDNVSFTVTRRSCHRQHCPVCSWKWQKKQGENSADYLRSLANHLKVDLFHCVFSPVKSAKIIDGKVVADKDDRGNVLYDKGMSAFKLAKFKQFVEKFHDGTNGEKVGYGYVMHPGEDHEEGSGIFVWQPHIHFVSNFHFMLYNGAWLPEMLQFCADNGFIFTTLRKIDLVPYHTVEEGGQMVRKGGQLERTMVYELSHAMALFKEDGTEKRRPAVVYGGAFRPGLYDVERAKHKHIVCANNHPMYATKITSIERQKTRVDIHYERENGIAVVQPASEWSSSWQKWLKYTKIRVVAISNKVIAPRVKKQKVVGIVEVRDAPSTIQTELAPGLPGPRYPDNGDLLKRVAARVDPFVAAKAKQSMLENIDYELNVAWLDYEELMNDALLEYYEKWVK